MILVPPVSVAYSHQLILFYIYFPQPSRIPDDPGAPRVAYSLRLTLFYDYFLSLAGFQMILVRHLLSLSNTILYLFSSA
jgi:hypothetical protein